MVWFFSMYQQNTIGEAFLKMYADSPSSPILDMLRHKSLVIVVVSSQVLSIRRKRK